MNAETPELDDQSKVRREKLNKLREQGRAYPHGVKVKDLASEITNKFNNERDDATLGGSGTFELAGRVHFVRSFGKAGFVKIRDRSGSMQLHVAKDRIDATSFEDFKDLDLGDIVKASGVLFRTKTGELSLEAAKFEILVKCLHAPPEKFHGLSDVEERYRRRYLDLMSSDETRKVFETRSKIVSGIREFLTKRDFMEVETPMMHSLVTGANARPFVTHHNTLDMKLFLRIAPELHLKRLVVGGFERVFEINRNFRNEGISVRHNPEFTMLEFYMSYATYEDLMSLTEELVEGLCQSLHQKTKITYQGNELNFARPWKRISMEDAVASLSSFKGKIGDAAAMSSHLKKLGAVLSGREGPGTLLSMIFEEEVDKKLSQPTFVTSYPVEVSPLARRSKERSKNGIDVTDRFELFVDGKEIANGFNELSDPDDQRSRFEAQSREKAAGNLEMSDYDEDFVKALEYGLPPTAGEGIGIDRLTMLLTDSASIRDVILFPQLRL
jgi:lysyl-tRNA synthetase class 2